MAAPAAAPQRPGRTAPAAVRLALTAAVLAGALVSLQQRVNGELGVVLGDALLAAAVSFATGLLVVALVVVSRPAARRAVGRVRTVPRWHLLGGLGGALLVLLGATAAPLIGVALFTVGLVAGQVAGGLLVDRVGLGPGGSHALTGPRVAGALLCLVAVGISALGEVRTARPGLLALVVVAGLLVSAQQAVNGRLRTSTGDAGAATLLNFVIGLAALLVGLALNASVSGLDVASWPGPDRWYLYTGGPSGAVFVTVATLVVRRLGVLRLSLAVLAGQLLGALVLDLVLPADGVGLALPTVAGAALTLVAVAVSGRGRKR